MSHIRTITALAAASAAIAALVAAPAVSAAPAAKKYTTCTALKEAYPSGLARSAALAKKAEKKGYERPAVNKAAYKKSAKAIKPSPSGVLCAVKGSPSANLPDLIVSNDTPVVEAKVGQKLLLQEPIPEYNMTTIGSSIQLLDEDGPLTGFLAVEPGTTQVDIGWTIDGTREGERHTRFTATVR